MSILIRRIIMSASALVIIVLQPITLIAMVIAPPCTGIGQRADIYKVISIAVFSAGYYLLAWRRKSLLAAIALPTIQVASGWLFAAYLNSLPMSCRH